LACGPLQLQMKPSWYAAPFGALALVELALVELDEAAAGVLLVDELFFELDPQAAMPTAASTAQATAPSRLILNVFLLLDGGLRSNF
jgi:hypothetical protein